MNQTLPFAILLLFFFVLCLLVLWRNGLLKNKAALFTAAALLLVALWLRLRGFSRITYDYDWFLKDWIQFFRDNGGFRGLSRSVGNYNFPYLYFLALFSYLPFYDLFLIKALSVFFDLVLAWSCMKLAGVCGAGETRRLVAFLGALLLPTVILNGAYWGQCDSIYAALAVMSVYLALDDHPILSMAAVAASFSFKLQAVFIMPVFLIFLYTGRIKLRHLPVFPATFVAMALPAVAMGRPFKDALTLYIDQFHSTGTAPNYNSASVYTFIYKLAEEHPWVCPLGIGLAFGFLFIIYYRTLLRRRRLGKPELLLTAAVIVTVVPLLLPYMHDRYFFLADVLTFVLAVVICRDALVPALVSFASLVCYHPFLYGRVVIDPRYCTCAVALAAAFMLGELGLRLHVRRRGSGR